MATIDHFHDAVRLRSDADSQNRVDLPIAGKTAAPDLPTRPAHSRALLEAGAKLGLSSYTKHMKQNLFLFLMAVTWQGSAPAADIY